MSYFGISEKSRKEEILLKKATKILNNIYIIDGYDLKMPERTGTYVLTEKELTIIETSASPSVPHILEGIKDLGYSPKDLKYIIVTHIHLDHAGGAGLLLKECPYATVVVHPKGKRHLIDPTRLIAGARAVYGELFDELFHPIIPIPENRIIEKNHQETLNLGNDCILTFYDTPGHANHHFSIFHPKVKGIFSGDTCGVSYPQLEKDGVQFYLPSTSPNHFDPEKMIQSINFIKDLNANYLFFGHYGMNKNPEEVFKQVSHWIDIFVSTAKETAAQFPTFEQQAEQTEKKLLNKIREYLRMKGIADDHPAYSIIKMDMKICSMGLIDYIHKMKKD